MQTKLEAKEYKKYWQVSGHVPNPLIADSTNKKVRVLDKVLSDAFRPYIIQDDHFRDGWHVDYRYFGQSTKATMRSELSQVVRVYDFATLTNESRNNVLDLDSSPIPCGAWETLIFCREEPCPASVRLAAFLHKNWSEMRYYRIRDLDSGLVFADIRHRNRHFYETKKRISLLSKLIEVSEAIKDGKSKRAGALIRLYYKV